MYPMYAVIAYQGHQYIVSQWDEIVVDNISWSSQDDQIVIDTVLMTFDEEGKNVVVGKPFVEKAKVVAQVKQHQRWEKIRVFKFQWKKRYHKTKWFKSHQTVLSIQSV